MTGRQFYEAWQAACLQVSNCGTDDWQELSDDDRAAEILQEADDARPPELER